MSTTPPRLRALDGLRGWGALTVVIYHTFIEVFPVSGNIRDLMWRAFFFNGTFAVTVFFLVSGISLSIGFTRTGDYSLLLKIALGRYFRLTVPIVIACLIAWLASISGTTVDPTHRENARSLIDVLQFAVYEVYANNDPSRSPIPPLWTMPIELLGSAIVLMLLAVSTRSRVRFAVYCVAAVSLWIRWPYLSAFVIGVAISELRAMLPRAPTRLKSVAGLLFIAMAALAAMFLPGASNASYVAVASLMVLGVVNLPLATALLETRVSRWLGTISFPLYLLHSIVLFSLGTWLHPYLSTEAVWSIAGKNVIIVAACLAISTALASIDQAGIKASRLVVEGLLSLTPKRPARR